MIVPDEHTPPKDHAENFLDLHFRSAEVGQKTAQSALELFKAWQTLINGINSYYFEFMAPFWVALQSFQRTEKRKIFEHPPQETASDYFDLFRFNMEIAKKGLFSTARVMNQFHASEMERWSSAWLNTLLNRPGEDIAQNAERFSRLVRLLTNDYPQAIRDIEPRFGFHFDDGGYIKVAETDRFTLYQVLPWEECTEVRPNGKPVLIIPPYVLGASILGFLPGEGKSYTHSFANQGIPTYIRIMKDIQMNPALQTMTGEDDCRDMKRFCEVIRKRHGKPVTLNGYCQGGFIAVLDLISGELDGLVDAFITCVAPMDGTRSNALKEYLEHLPTRFRDLGYAIKTLPNGNRVVDGKVMSWVYKLKSMDSEAPIYTYYRDLMMFNRENPENIRISSTAAALNYWLIYDRNDLPVSITQLSFDSYTKPVAGDGTLPVKLFGKSLNFKRLQDKGIPWLLCYSSEDNLVDRDAAIAPADYIDLETTVFPKGHGAIATSWSLSTSACALHTHFKGGRGPVRFQLDLDGIGKKGQKKARNSKRG